MNATRCATLCILALTLTLAACATKPPAPEGKPLTGPEALPELEANYKAYLQKHKLPRAGETHNLQQLIQEKFSAFEKLRNTYRDGTKDARPEVSSYSAYRLGQLYLNLACEVVAIEPNIASDEQDQKHFRDSMREQAIGFVAPAYDAFNQAFSSNIQPWNTRASEIVVVANKKDDHGAALLDNCSALVSHWKAI